MTHRQETHRGVDVHVTGSGMTGFFGVYQVGSEPKKWAAASSVDEALRKACERIDEYYLQYSKTDGRDCKN